MIQHSGRNDLALVFFINNYILKEMTQQHWCKELSFGAKSYLQLVVQKYLNSDGLSLKCASQKFFTTTILIIAMIVKYP